MRVYILHILIAIDQLATALIGGFPDETLSSYAWRMEQQGKPWGRITRPLIDWLALTLFGDEDHCARSTASERARAQEPPELR